MSMALQCLMLSGEHILHSRLTATTQEHVDTLHDVILFWVVWMLLGWDFQDGWDCGIVVLEDVSDVIGDVLVDEDDADIITRTERLEGIFDLLQFGVLLHDEEIGTLRGSVSDSCQEESCDGVLFVRSFVRSLHSITVVGECRCVLHWALH